MSVRTCCLGLSSCSFLLWIFLDYRCEPDPSWLIILWLMSTFAESPSGHKQGCARIVDTRAAHAAGGVEASTGAASDDSCRTCMATIRQSMDILHTDYLGATWPTFTFHYAGWRSGKRLPQVTLSSRTGPQVTRSLLNEEDVVRDFCHGAFAELQHNCWTDHMPFLPHSVSFIELQLHAGCANLTKP